MGASIAACSRGNWLFYPRATRRASDAQGLTGTCTPLGHATRMSRVRPRDAAAEERYDYSGQKRSASFDMGALLSALSSVVGDKDGDPQLLLALRGLLSTSVTRQGLLEAGSKLFDGELFEAIDRGCADDELRVLCKKGFVKVFGKEAPDEEVQRKSRCRWFRMCNGGLLPESCSTAQVLLLNVSTGTVMRIQQ